MDAPESPSTPAVRSYLHSMMALETGRISVVVEEASGVAV
jgi:hypothetical protein